MYTNRSERDKKFIKSNATSNISSEFQASGSFGESTRISREDQKWVQQNPYSEISEPKKRSLTRQKINKVNSTGNQPIGEQTRNSSSMEGTTIQLPDLRCYTSRQSDLSSFSPTKKSPTLKMKRNLRRSEIKLKRYIDQKEDKLTQELCLFEATSEIKLMKKIKNMGLNNVEHVENLYDFCKRLEKK